ncbi:MAG: hypothetical protein AAB284_01760, partial [Chloroflexota bacterium]
QIFPRLLEHLNGGDKPEFADLITGKCKGRTSRDQITFYRNVGNQGLQFSSVGALVYRKARAAGRSTGACYYPTAAESQSEIAGGVR